MERHVVLPDPGGEGVGSVPLDAVVLVWQPLAVARSFFTEGLSCHFPTADSGREVRALIASFLL
jgi:hypothetical protein